MSELQLKILFVDDDTEIFQFFEDASETLKLEPLFAEDGQKAIELCRKHQNEIAIIVSDLKMPNTDGFALKELLNEEFSDIPFILSSGHVDKDLALKALDLGIKSILNKPYKQEELVNLVNEKAADRIEELEEDFEMKSEFMGDAKSLAQEVEDCLISFENQPDNLALVNNIMRLLHTIKGTAACLGLTQLSKFTHQYEDFFGPISRSEKTASEAFVSVALGALDTLNHLVAHLTQLPLPDFDVEEAVKMFELSDADFSAPAAKKDVAPKTAAPASAEKADEPAKEKEDEISVSISLLDEFMEQSGELTVLKSMIVKQVQSLESEYGQSESLERLVESLEEMNHVSGSIQNKIVEIRKVPVKNILRQLPRVARDTCRATGKDIDLQMTGQNLRIDQSIGDALQNVLVHMIRNSIDHGIEDPETRKSRDKDPKGLVKVECEENADFVTVTISDDGGGVLPDKVASIAEKKGLYTAEELAKMSDQRKQEIIFEPGFSTVEQVTDISGRGVGMDMVASTVREMNGQCTLRSVVGEGSKIELVFPVPKSVLIIRALFLRIGSETFTINQDDIEKVLMIEADNRSAIKKIDDESFIDFDDQLVPIIDLTEIFNIDAEVSKNKNEYHQNLVILRAEDKVFAIEVDEILENDEIVVKDIDEGLQALKVYAGATFLGDGKVALVLQPEGILEHQGIKLDAHNRSADQPATEENGEIMAALNEYLVLEEFDGQVAAMPLTDVYRLETCAKKDVEFVHNQPVIKYLNRSMPLFSYFSDLNHEGLPDSFQIIVHSFQSGPVGFVIREVLDIQAPETELDETLKSGHIKGSVNIKGKITQVINTRSISSDKLKDAGLATSVESGQDKQTA